MIPNANLRRAVRLLAQGFAFSGLIALIVIAWTVLGPDIDDPLRSIVDRLAMAGLGVFLLGAVIWIAARGVFDLIVFAFQGLFHPTTPPHEKRLGLPSAGRQRVAGHPACEKTTGPPSGVTRREAVDEDDDKAAQDRRRANERLAIRLMLAGAWAFLLSLLLALTALEP
ncbi:hypothetical protein AB1399_03545 [Hydrogenibacillus schlegelii]|uniref:DUF3899 domain-containing protein n=1 Tax=Hydrogenibacillus schlegelii TaxID=1484 RepID=A0A132NB17_HYDSH|nr:hypothetical protein [Hydrogenibacillus schlegelii]KWX07293.1 hypothetical protein TR75_03405 [Hydrogenibacillus schlegelii]OAR04900.1 hypothetical protein SA87_09870 [Hydrogenibacillus schlegelii]